MFGGSFDPPHLAHIEIVNRLIVDCDKLYIFPAKQSPYKVNEAVRTNIDFNRGQFFIEPPFINLLATTI